LEYNIMAYIPETNSVVAFQGNPSVLQVLATVTNPVSVLAVTISGNPSISGQVGASVIGHAPVVIVGGSVAASFTPPANQSVSGTVQAELLSTNASVITVGSPVANQSISGTVGASVIGNIPVKGVGSIGGAISVPPVIIGVQDLEGNLRYAQSANDGDLTVHQHSSLFTLADNVSNDVYIPVNQTDLGFMSTPTAPYYFDGTTWDRQRGDATNGMLVNLGANNDVTITGNPSISGQVGASIIGLTPVNVSNTNLNVSGSIVAFQAGTRITSVISSTPSSMLVGASIIGLTPVNVTNTNINVSGSVVAQVTGLQGHSVSGTVATTQSGTWISSVVNTVPSSMLVGASIIGLTPVSISNFPTNQNVSGSVVAFVSGTPNVNTAGSVVAFQGTNPWVIQSIVGTYAEDSAHTSADKGLFILGVRNDAVASFTGSNGEYNPFAHDSAGRVLNKPFAAEEARIEGYNSVVSTSVTTLIAAAGTGLKNYITDIVLVNTGATTTLVTFRSGGGTSVLGYGIAPSGGGSNMIGFATPMRTLANETFDFQATSSSSILFAKVSGFKAP